MSSVGLQLYTVRVECARDFAGTLAAVGEIGYDGVELYDLHGCDPRLVRRWLDELRLAPCGRHASLEAVETRLPELAQEAQELGWRRLVVGWLDPATLEDPALAARLRTAADGASERGLELGFHNHDAELRPLASGRTFLDGVPSELFLELDLGWAWYAGADPISLLLRARDRCPLVHVKDFRSREGREFCPVGDGAVGYERVAPAAVEAGVEWLVVEQDETDGPALEAARRSFEALTSMLQVAA